MGQGSGNPGVELIPRPALQKRILVVRESHVMLDEDLEELYGVETRRLVEQVKRNIDRFPDDFMFQLSSALRQLISPPPRPKRRVGFGLPENE